MRRNIGEKALLDAVTRTAGAKLFCCRDSDGRVRRMVCKKTHHARCFCDITTPVLPDFFSLNVDLHTSSNKILPECFIKFPFQALLQALDTEMSHYDMKC